MFDFKINKSKREVFKSEISEKQILQIKKYTNILFGFNECRMMLLAKVLSVKYLKSEVCKKTKAKELVCAK